MSKFPPVDSSKAPPEIIGMIPQNLDAVEFRTVRWKIVQVQSSFRSLTAFFVHKSTFMNGRIVEQDDAQQ